MLTAGEQQVDGMKALLKRVDMYFLRCAKLGLFRANGAARLLV
jgi:hypothetical protein